MKTGNDSTKAEAYSNIIKRKTPLRQLLASLHGFFYITAVNNAGVGLI